MGRTERRKFFRNHPYCQICEKLHKRTKSTMIMTPGIAVCNQCAVNVAALRAKQQEILDKKNKEEESDDEKPEGD